MTDPSTAKRLAGWLSFYGLVLFWALVVGACLFVTGAEWLWAAAARPFGGGPGRPEGNGK